MSDVTFPARGKECPHCQRSLDGVPTMARFCPRCGKSLVVSDAAGGIAQILRHGVEQLAESLKEEFTPLPDDGEPQSLVLLGFSNAMYRLGWRYEHGRGIFRNVTEAERCYAKSARLGNAHAKEQLEGKAAESRCSDPSNA